jgi:hypothetical protein
MLAIRTGSAIECDGGECRAIKSDNNSLSSVGSEKAVNGIVDVQATLDNHGRDEKCPQPAQFRSCKHLQPHRSLRKAGAQLVSDLGITTSALPHRMRPKHPLA